MLQANILLAARGVCSLQMALVSRSLSLASFSGHRYKAPWREFASSTREFSWVSVSAGSGEFSLQLGLECGWEASHIAGHGGGKPTAARESLSSARLTSWRHLLESTSFSLEFRHFILLF